MAILLELFWSFFQIGLFSFGGGYAVLPLIQTQIVDKHHWLNLQEYLDLITVSQMTPGPIAINAATFAGLQIYGIPGAIVATLACVLPSFIVISIMAHFYFKYRKTDMTKSILNGLRPAVVAMISVAGLVILKACFWTSDSFQSLQQMWHSLDYFALLLCSAAFIILRKYKLDPIWIILGSGVMGGIFYML